ncbi:hypothetical protein [Pseudoroseicyclus sp. CXY001]|uniref:hypothetical protein n=1 Tax=Pseudoroseicyclus sp. CXY001 TaxID=3242492 RepID=UPI00358DB41E
MQTAERRGTEAPGDLNELTAVVSTVEQVFTAAADALIAGQDSLSVLTRTLASCGEGLADLSAAGVVDAVEVMAGRVQGAGAAHGAESEAVARIARVLEENRKPMQHLRDQVKMLETFTSTARVVEVECGQGQSTEFSQEIKRLTERSQKSYAEMKRLSDTMARMAAGIGARQAGFRDGGLQDLERMNGALLAVSTSVAPRLQVAASDAGRLAGAVGGLTARLSAGLTDMQVGDSFRQRLEHAFDALERYPAGGDAAGALIGIIAVAQLDAATLELDATLRRINRTMQIIAEETEELVVGARQLMESSDLAPLLTELQALSGKGLAALQASRRKREGLDEELRKLRETVGRMQGVLEAQSSVDEQMKLGSYNVSLSSRRSSRGRAAMSYVAAEIGRMVDECLASRGEIVRQLDVVSETVATTVGAGEGRADDLGGISERLEGLGRMLGLWAELGERLKELEVEGPRAAASFRDCARRMVAEQATTARMHALVARMRQALPQADPAALWQQPPARSAADWMRGLYSVPEERHIHDRLCGAELAPPPPAAATSAAQSGGDDGFDWF